MDTSTDFNRAVGTIGLGCVIGVMIILGIHPFGTTDLYDDGQAFLDHIGGFWIAIHLLGAVFLLGFPLVIWRWSTGLADPMAQALGALAAFVATAGMGVGVIHLVATDTVSFFAFADTLEAAGGSEAAVVSADLLLRLHAATLVAWMLSFWFLAPAVLGGALATEQNRPMWMTAIAGIAALCQVVSMAMFFEAGQHTTAGETGFFRVGVTLFLVLVGIMAWELRRGAPVGSPALESVKSTESAAAA